MCSSDLNSNRPRKAVDVRQQIPQFQSDQVQTLKYRYCLAPAASDVEAITFELPVYPFGYSTSSLSLACPMKSVRLRKVEMWTNYRSAVDISGNAHSVTYPERRGVRPYELSQQATQVSPAHYSKYFSENDYMGWWFSTTSGEVNPELTIQMTKGSILELTFDYVMDDADIVVTAPSSGLTSNRIYTNTISEKLVAIGKSFHIWWVM